jgi:hypothetical protein
MSRFSVLFRVPEGAQSCHFLAQSRQNVPSKKQVVQTSFPKSCEIPRGSSRYIGGGSDRAGLARQAGKLDTASEVGSHVIPSVTWRSGEWGGEV